MRDKKCFKCGGSDHWAANCTSDDYNDDEETEHYVNVRSHGQSASANANYNAGNPSGPHRPGCFEEGPMTAAALRRGRYRRTTISQHAAHIQAQLMALRAEKAQLKQMIVASLVENTQHFTFIEHYMSEHMGNMQDCMAHTLETQMDKVCSTIDGGATTLLNTLKTSTCASIRTSSIWRRG